MDDGVGLLVVSAKTGTAAEFRELADQKPNFDFSAGSLGAEIIAGAEISFVDEVENNGLSVFSGAAFGKKAGFEGAVAKGDEVFEACAFVEAVEKRLGMELKPVDASSGTVGVVVGGCMLTAGTESVGCAPKTPLFGTLGTSSSLAGFGRSPNGF